MADLESIRHCLAEAKIMQLATAADNQPWLCTLHFAADEDLNLYWFSTLQREHSQAIAANPRVAAYVLVHENTPEEPWVIGISIAGTAELLGQHVPAPIGEAYVRKHDKAANFLPDIASGHNPHKFYRLTPARIVLFDNKNFPDDPRREMAL